MRTLIVDDEYLARERMKELAAEHARVTIIGEATTGAEAVQAIESMQPDVVLLDIAMPAMDGFEVLSCVETSPLPLVIFTTAFDQHAVRAFDVAAVDYLLKPIDRARFAEALQRAEAQLTTRQPAEQKLRQFLESKPANRIVVRQGDRIVFVKPQEIDAVEAVGNYVRIHRSGERFLIRQTLSSLEERLAPHGFARIQRSVLVNVERVSELRRDAKDGFVVVLASGETFRLTTSYRANLEQLLGAF
ncbi:MAG TPA: LytTR family DNA-binding domain-containing protein [Thermoanaerobaculia bacterium]